MSSLQYKPETVLSFWFDEISPQQWWVKSDDFDRLIGARFGVLQQAAARCELFEWRVSALGRLAEIIVLDQFSRNIYRDQAQAFACDALALGLAQWAVAVHADLELDVQHRAFLYMPFMHSESEAIHTQAVTLFGAPGLEGNLAFEFKHKDIIDRFGRYPHRNASLGRLSTPQEMVFLASPGSSF
jgi:uncharacterized protein (DUF924 family)